MTSYIPYKRPDCEKILENKQNWALNPKDFEINQHQASILKSINTNEKFSVSILYSILQAKFNYNKNLNTENKKFYSSKYNPTFKFDPDDSDDDFIGFSICI
jgi:hypothetical protein